MFIDHVEGKQPRNKVNKGVKKTKKKIKNTLQGEESFGHTSLCQITTAFAAVTEKQGKVYMTGIKSGGKHNDYEIRDNNAT